jgi:hypothetical protein
MLLDLKPKGSLVTHAKDKDFDEFIEGMVSVFSSSAKTIEPGIYLTGFNFSPLSYFDFSEVSDNPKIEEYDSFNYCRGDDFKSQYGVADNIEQIKNYFKEVIEDTNRKFFITVTPVYQNKLSEGGGWRWHKWGEYIGELNPQCEYLDDEDFGADFQYVLVYHLYEVLETEKITKVKNKINKQFLVIDDGLLLNNQ